MSNLKQRIKEDLNSALKKKKEIELSTLRMLSAAVLNKEKEKRYKFTRQNFPEENLGGLSKEKLELLEKESQLNDEEILQVISSEIKKRKEAVLLVRRSLGEGGEKEKIENFINKEQQELEILQNYLPEQMPEEEIKKLAEETIKKLGATSIKDMGKIMAELMLKIKGQAEGSLVSKIVKDLLTPKTE